MELWNENPNDREEWEMTEARRETYRAPRSAKTVAPESVTRTPHRSTEGTMAVDAIAIIKLLTPL